MRPKHIASCLLLLTLACLAANGQDKLRLSIDDVIRTAQDSTITAFRNETAREKAEWEFRQFIAGRKFRLDLNILPVYNKYVNTPYLNYYKEYNYNTLGTRAEVRLQQPVNFLGGNFYAATSTMWNEFLADSKDIDRIFSSIPVGIGYTNDLLGYNPFKWEKELEHLKLETAYKTYIYNLQQIAMEAASYYLDYLLANSELEICLTNQKVFADMLDIAKEKYEIASVTKSELAFIQLQYVNLENSAFNLEQKARDKRNELLSFLQIEDSGQELEIVVPEPGWDIFISQQDAVNLALSNSPRLLEVKENIIRKKQQADKADAEKGMQVSLDLNFGMQTNSSKIAALFDVPATFSVLGVGISIPLVDHGLAASRSKAAGYDLKMAELEEDDMIRIVELEATNTLADFNNQQSLLRRTIETLDLADESFDLVEELYSTGLTDINTFLLAQISKDNSYQNYLESLRDYWESYYKLQALCLYDFINDEPCEK